MSAASGDHRKCANSLGDTFHFELQDVQFVHGSGAKHTEIVQRWYVDLVHGQLSPPPPTRTSVRWIQWQDVYAARVKRMASDGVVHGRFQLVLRVDPTDSRITTKPAMWRASRVPKTWNGDVVNDILPSLKFRDIELSKKKRRGQTTDWLVRVIALGSDQVFQPFFEDEDGEIVELLVAKESMRRQSKHRSQPLRNEFRFTFPSDQQPPKKVNGEDPLR